MLDDVPVASFIDNGYVHIPDAFPRALAEECRAIIWRDLNASPDDPHSWPIPAAFRPDYLDAPFVSATATPRLRAAYDALVGPGRWAPRRSLGSFVIRFPGQETAALDGWHVDASFPGPESAPADYLSWRVNVHSKDRALLMLFLFSDTGEPDAPTRLRVGSHKEVARLLEPEGDAGLDARALAARAEAATAGLPTAYATGRAGDVYLCHPFLVHAGQPNRGVHPRFLAQPNLSPAQPLRITGAGPFSAVETAIRSAVE
ncbi:phytanoyl-CoA dioxygenase family protein [Nocardia jinanensis]|uniref:Phytanoyl-CoA dioxygenase n=1 Tax=Nocardia jinanensis TaxID=382504 RepID=A0A917VX22_9NOCA|nr:phytanoyl-CoA dioxygenase family protein [Nocardia jinanensis]GGL27259.1 phytanoyl-CoA dioxygenase [Nocardia jinanensis]